MTKNLNKIIYFFVINYAVCGLNNCLSAERNRSPRTGSWYEKEIKSKLGKIEQWYEKEIKSRLGKIEQWCEKYKELLLIKENSQLYQKEHKSVNKILKHWNKKETECDELFEQKELCQAKRERLIQKSRELRQKRKEKHLLKNK